MMIKLSSIKSLYWSARERYFQDFIFIHINKTGGTSIETALGIRHQHRTVKEKIMDIGIERWQNKFTFTVVRNPWDRIVSQYHYRLAEDRSLWGGNPIDFNSWIKAVLVDQDPMYFRKRMFMGQVDWLSGRDGTISIDFMARFERFEEDFKAICEIIDRSAQLPHLKRTKRTHYREYYNDESIEIVRNWARRDIKQLGYSFD